MDYSAKLSSDSPVADPAEDAYGYSGFAKNLAKAICITPSPSGLVMAINAPWGAGKSSLLNFIKYELKTAHARYCPVIIDFNPWWFNGRDQLASQLLAQFSSKLSNESAQLLAVGALMAEYSSALSKAVALWTGIPWIDTPVNFFLKLLKRKPKEVPEAKAAVAKALASSGRRILVVIDDLDRLTPDEIRELFKVVKALADFPNVIYLLSFDQDVVADALRQSLGVDGSAYLEKIVQAPFSLPAVEKLRLQNKLFSDLNTLVDSLPQPKFDTTYWGNVYYDGLEHFIRKPRDVVRLINALAVTYPPVAGEVNPVDFIALEVLRVFSPDAYMVIRDNRNMFTGVLSDSGTQGAEVKKFHGEWLAKVDERDRMSITALLERLFPKVESALGNMNYGTDFLGTWRQELRVCSHDLFSLYFQFGIPSDYLTQAELNSLLALSADIPVLTETLKAARSIIRPDGHSKARDYVERLRRLKGDELAPTVAKGLLIAIFSVEGDLLIPADEHGGTMKIPNTWRVDWLIGHLLDRVLVADRVALITHCIQDSRAYACLVSLVGRLIGALEDATHRKPYMEGFDEVAVEALKVVVLTRLGVASLDEFLASTETRYILHFWSQWGDAAQLKIKLAPVLSDNALLSSLLVKFLGTGSSHGMGDRVARITYHLDPRALEPYFDLESLTSRIESMLPALEAGAQVRIAAEKFLKGMARVREGKPTGGQTVEEMFDGD
jgi:predicted KAP-like P-loop ATPase